MSMGGPGEPESLIRADSLAFLSHGSRPLHLPWADFGFQFFRVYPKSRLWRKKVVRADRAGVGGDATALGCGPLGRRNY
jgi:hypothetical protein